MSLVRSSLVVSLASVGSRLFGFARDVMLAQAFGAGPVADAFLAAFRFPNALKRILSEGGLNPALVPMLARLKGEESRRFAGEALSALGLALLVLVVLVEIAAGLVVLVLAPGLAREGETFALATLYMRLVFPMVMGVALASLIAAVLNANRRFAAAALASVVVNAGIVAALFVLPRTSLPPERQGAILALSATLFGFFQLAVIGLALLNGERPIAIRRPRWTPALARLLSATLVTILASGAAQIFILVGTQAASFLPSGLSWLYYADRVMQLPLGIVATVAGVVLLPELAKRHVAGDRGEVIAAQNRALELSALIGLPAAVGLACLAEPIAAVLFERGAFGPQDTLGTAAALRGLALALPFAILGKVLSQTLFAAGAARACLAALLAGLLGTAFFSFVLMGFGVFGVACGIAAGALAHAAALALALNRRGLWAPSAWSLRAIARIALASGIMALALRGALPLAPVSAPGLAALCLLGLAVHGASVIALGVVGASDFRKLLKKP